jgi:hypothetical protein
MYVCILYVHCGPSNNGPGLNTAVCMYVCVYVCMYNPIHALPVNACMRI